MSLARVYSRAGVGVTAPEVVVEVHLGGGLPKMSLVGLAETAVRESKDRVKAALLNAGFNFPQAHITISLAPADLRKDGSRFDLPIALGILAASGQVSDRSIESFEFIGELSLGGRLNPVQGVLPAALQAGKSGRGLVVPQANSAEVALADAPRQYHAADLLGVVSWLNGRSQLDEVATAEHRQPARANDLSEVVGQHRARRALEVAAAGSHNLLFTGPPGTGKTMLASRLPGILPPMSKEEALEAAAIASISQVGLDLQRWKTRSFRAPHHTASAVALVGGGPRIGPGEISLAHHGVLFLDELPEFNRNVLEVLREPLESGRIVISRAAGRAEFPACFQLVAAMNPCPCGFNGDTARHCGCSAEQINRYCARVSGPLLDRIDLFVEVTRPAQVVIPGKAQPGESSSAIRQRVLSAHDIQIARQGMANARLEVSGVKRHCRLNNRDEYFVEDVATRLGLSPRGCQRLLKVARTIADLDGAGRIARNHLAEAVGFRQPG